MRVQTTDLVRGLALLCVATTGCRCMPPLKTESKANLTVDHPVEAKVYASVNTLPDPGPLVETPIAPCGLGDAAGHGHGAKVAIIDVDGVLVNTDTAGPFSMGENPVAVFYEKLQAAAKDPAVKAVVLRINSPGGSVAATEAMWRSLVDFRRLTGKPIVASVLDLGRGGAYYLASACDQVFAQPSSVVGGIGVILNVYWLELAMEQWNAFGFPIKAGDRIDMGTPIRKVSAEEKTMLNAMANEYQGIFKQAVLKTRTAVKPESAVFDGRVMTATKARDEGLIDTVGFLPDAIEQARQLVQVDVVTAVMFRRSTNPARSLYDTTPNKAAQGALTSASVPGLDRSKLPLFLYLWQAEPTLVKTAIP